MPRHSDSIRLLLGQGPVAARQIVEATRISQPTVSRALAALGDEVVRIGSGSAIRYALRDTARGFVSAPVFRVSDAGQIRELGTLVPVRPNGFVMVQADGVSRYSDGLPWWLFDMRPQGYLGRAYASTYATALGLPANPEHWGDNEVIRALLVHGHDAIGNLLIGELARDRFIGMPAPCPVDRAADYPALARAAGAGEVPGSSAGGEQPQFCTYTERGHAAGEILGTGRQPGQRAMARPAACRASGAVGTGRRDRGFDFGGQRFLEVPRFDRVGPLGRMAVFSLRALDAEFIGDVWASWPSLVSRLAAEGHVDADAVTGAARLWAFGTLIGNTDMHAGNLSFVSRHGRPYQLAPAYDVLPMGFAPGSGGAFVDALPPASLSASVDGETWREALHLAERFFALLSDCDGFSDRFTPCIEAMGQHIDEAA